MDFFCHQSTASSPAHRRCNSISSNTFPACPFRPLVRPRACAWNFPRGAPSPFLSPWERGKPGSPSCSVSRGAKSSGQSGNAIPRTSPVGGGGGARVGVDCINLFVLLFIIITIIVLLGLYLSLLCVYHYFHISLSLFPSIPSSVFLPLTDFIPVSVCPSVYPFIGPRPCFRLCPPLLPPSTARERSETRTGFKRLPRGLVPHIFI